MKRAGSAIGLPLLDKELTEQAARRRTYVLRVLYAVALFVAFLVAFDDVFGRVYERAYQTLGVGRDMFEFLVMAQFVGILAFLPGMMSGVVAAEKERGSLPLLFLTDLGPWQIIVQKLLGRLVPMLSFLLLSLPLMAVAYGFGGISSDYVASGVWLLFLTCLQVGTFALMVSTYCRTSAQAFVGSYAFLALYYLSVPILLSLLGGLRHADEEVVFAFIPPAIFENSARKGFGTVLAMSVPVMISTGVFLVLSRVFLVRRAFVKPKDFTLRLFKALDLVMKRWNRAVGNIMLLKDRSSLPGDDPVAWRETTKKALGKPHYLFRVLVAAEVPVVLVSAFILMDRGQARVDTTAFMVMAFILWGLAVLAVAVKSASSVITERTRQTLDALLTTPLTGRDIVLQKMRGAWRLIYVLWIPFMTVFLVEAYVKGVGGPRSTPWGGSSDIGAFTYLASSILAIVVYLPMFSWAAFWMGLRSRGRSRAAIAVLGGIVAWCAAPFALLAVLDALGANVSRGGFAYLALMSPVTLIGATELGEFGPFGDVSLVPITLNYLWHGGVLFFFRHLCLTRADRYLGRM